MLVFVASPRMDIRCRSKGKRVGIKRSVGRLWRLCGGMVCSTSRPCMCANDIYFAL